MVRRKPPDRRPAPFKGAGAKTLGESTALTTPVREPARRAAELTALRRMLDASRGCFSLAFAVCNTPALRDHLLEQLRSSHPGIEVVRLASDTTDVFGSVAASTQVPARTALFVVGLEDSLDSTKARQTALASLNASRELWEQRFPCPVVCWLPDFAVALLSREARDFFRYRSHRFEFVSDQAVPVAAQADRFSGDLSAAGSLSADEKRFRIAELKQRISQAGNPPSENLVIHVLVWIGELVYLYFSIDDLDAAEAMCKKSLSIAEKFGRPERTAEAYGNLGVIYKARGDLDQAEAMYEKALAINEDLNRLEGMAVDYHNLGLVYRNRGELEQAERTFAKALRINLMFGSKTGLALAYANLGIVHAMRGDLDAAEGMYKKSLAINEDLGQLEGAAGDHANLGIVYRKRGDLKAARQLWIKARDLYAKIGMPHMVKQMQSWLDSLPPPTAP